MMIDSAEMAWGVSELAGEDLMLPLPLQLTVNRTTAVKKSVIDLIVLME